LRSFAGAAALIGTVYVGCTLNFDVQKNPGWLGRGDNRSRHRQRVETVGLVGMARLGAIDFVKRGP